MVAAVVLAAGAGRRLGMPKAGVRLGGGTTFLERVLQLCQAGGCGRIWMVARPGVPGAPDATDLPGIAYDTVINPHPERGMFSSVRLGLGEALNSSAVGFLLFPVDHPQVHSATVAALVRSLSAGRPPWVCPAYHGRRGHPVGINRGTARLLVGLDPAASLRKALRSLSLEPLHLDVDDPAVLKNINRPGDL